MLLFSCANKNFLFWHLSNDCQIVRPALVSGPPNRKKPYNKHLISLVFLVRTVNYGSSFFSIDLWPARHKSMGKNNKTMEKNSVRNLQYGPKTRQIRGMNIIHFCWGSLDDKCLSSGIKQIFSLWLYSFLCLYIICRHCHIAEGLKKHMRLWHGLFWYKMLIFYSRHILMKK